MAQGNKGFSFVNIIPAILMLIAAFYVIGYIASGIYTILEFVAIGLFIITAIINHKVILDYGKMLINLVKRNPLMGIAGIILTVFFHPLVALFLFGKAMLLRKVDKIKKEFQGTTATQTRNDEGYAEFEEVEGTSIPSDNSKPEIVELPPLKEKPKQAQQNDYEDLFEE